MKEIVLPSIITLATITILFILTYKVGVARSNYKIKVPHTTGNVEFEKIFRTQQNMLENTIMFLPIFWISSVLFSDIISALLGMIWLCSRVTYSLAYTSKNPKKRSIPFMIAIATLAILFILACIGIVLHI